MVGRAATTEVGLSGLVNTDLTTYSGGFNYPQHGGTLTVGGIPFELATIGPQNDTGIIQTTGAQDFSIPVDVLGAMSVYVLVNSAYGACGSDVGEIDFVGSSQAYVYPLIEGVNIRDHFAGAFCNQASDVSGSASFGADRLDLNSIQLPSSFATQTLESIDFKSFGMGDLGQPFLAALSVENGSSLDAATFLAPVPEPGDLLFVGSAMAALVLRRRRWHRPTLVPLGCVLVGVGQGQHGYVGRRRADRLGDWGSALARHVPGGDALRRTGTSSVDCSRVRQLLSARHRYANLVRKGEAI